MRGPDQQSIDARIQHYYSDLFDEDTRLTTRSAQGPLEFDRTQELIRQRVSGGRVLDVGGGTGVHARALQRAGFEIDLVDPVPKHVEQARATGLSGHVGDARALEFPDGSFDATLLLGPLYHLSAREDRRRALQEAARVTRSRGVVFASALSRYVAFGALSLTESVPEELPDDWAALITRGVPSPDTRFPAGHFHSAEELEEELVDAGYTEVVVHGVEGPAGLMLEVARDLPDEVRIAARTIARAASDCPGIRDQSAHLLAIGVVP